MSKVSLLHKDSKLERLQSLIDEDAADQAVDRVSRWAEIGALLIEIKTERYHGDTRQFGGWLDAALPSVSKDDRAAYMGFARSPEAAAAARRDHAHRASARLVWAEVKHVESSQACELSGTCDPNLEAAQKTAPNTDVVDLSTSQAPAKKTPELVSQRSAPVGTKNPVHRWGEVGERLWFWFTRSATRSTWNKMASKRHGREVAELALEEIALIGADAPIPTEVKSPTARLVLPWLNSPLADDYDLSTPKRFERFKHDLPVIREACWPFFADGRKQDRSNECQKLFKRAVAAKADATRQVAIAERRERERLAVNTAGHPPIVVHGVELWPDGDQFEDLRLSYDEARFAFFLWREWDAAIAIGLKSIRERASFWQQRQRSFHGLNFARGAALSNFWHRCGRAMAEQPHAESSCQPIIRMS